ncbi:MAG: ferric reductase-like transmembrane domain-containing protein [Opitutales bacterium]|nr:ferric reductase-like transmembrane domain-containing protein [Opitutales bacterium]
MTETYKAIQWTPFKRAINNYLWVGISTYLVLYTLASFLFTPTISLEIILIRATGTCSFLLLNIILCIGPLCRLNTLFLPLIYNRRHMGMSCFLLAFFHALLMIYTYHLGSDMHPVVSVFTSDSGSTIATAPFQTFGAIALFILFIMAATSHDFWLAHLTPPLWKTLHMLVYIAYALSVAYIVFGILQSEKNIYYTVLLFIGVSIVCILHFTAAIKELVRGYQSKMNSDGDFVETFAVEDIPEKRAKMVQLHGEKVAIFKYDGKISAVSNVCQHENAPLGEGRIIDGLITCPWQGCQYRPENGAAPEPGILKVPTFEVKLLEGKIWVNHKPKLPGTYVEPAIIPNNETVEEPDDEFFIGWEQKVPPVQRRFLYNRLIGIFAFAFTLAILLPFLQKRHEPSFYTYTKEREFEGVFLKSPVPTVLIERPGTVPDNTLPHSQYLLVGKKKSGLDPELMEELDHKIIKFSGSTIFNRNQTMVEVNQKSIEVIGTSSYSSKNVPRLKKIGRFKLSGEIASSKNYFGRINPGYGKFQRASAVRSIAGGIPPVLIVRSEEGVVYEILLCAPEGKPISKQILDNVGIPVRVLGEVYQWGNILIIETTPDRIEKI